jgi:hypothetical protein
MDMHGCPLICKMKIHIRTMDMDGNTWASMDIPGDSLISVHIPMVGGVKRAALETEADRIKSATKRHAL